MKACVLLASLGWHPHLFSQNSDASEVDDLPEFEFAGPWSKVEPLGITDKMLYTAGAFLNFSGKYKGIALYAYNLSDLEQHPVVLGEVLSQAAAGNVQVALLIPSSAIAPTNTEGTYKGAGVRVSAQDWSVFLEPDRISHAWNQFSQDNSVIQQSNSSDRLIAFTQPLDSAFLDSESLASGEFAASTDLWQPLSSFEFRDSE